MGYSERLLPPLSWWLITLLGAAVLWPVIGIAVGFWWGLAVAAAVFAVIGAMLLAGSVMITVDADGLRVGRAWIEHRYLAEVRPLDAEQTRSRRGPTADARAYLVLRPYLKEAVEIALDDPADPVPYWLVSSRHPERLADALRDAAARTTPRG
ncbi:DUF3093 domain-containing protein [Microlunatus parietis]|uniref:DUF3093 domain-containing protein n=1 Tax=Microlunatus parietis TaxID=682979 RepID=A0A7Y9LG61_9ACTN|nr:DUF3093 domain-containing protein [Microlunatus parietis]NYE75538.1 hypothetical protein [Microlunatus parietis]